jgi:DNA polymerase-1
VSPQHVAVAFGQGLGALWSPHVTLAGSEAEVVAHVRRLEPADTRWVWWSAVAGARPLLAAGMRPARCWDVAEAHRLDHGGWLADAGRCWAAVQRLDETTLPGAPTGDLFEAAARDAALPDDELVRADGHLRPDAVSGDWQRTPARLLRWARTAYDVAELQRAALQAAGPRAVNTVHSESAAALLCEELARDGLPIDRLSAEQLIAQAAGPRTHSDAEAAAVRRDRDQAVLRHAAGHTAAGVVVDLRNPAQVRRLLEGVGVMVPSTRKWVLEPYRETHPIVDALLQWRKAERIATTYGYSWLDSHVGPDNRLRGGWTACDGGAGRMTAQNGLHNLPAALRPAVAAHQGHAFVRADLGQIEPRVLAVVSGDRRFATATQADDLYAPVAAALGVERPVAKVAVLAAMYGQRSGAAGEALQGLESAYPVAMGFLDRAYAVGLARGSLRTFGGRLIRSATVLTDGDETTQAARDAARGRFVRNAVIQGAAAELFKAWAATVRAMTADLGAQIVLCLHDELLVHAPVDRAEEVRARVVAALEDSSRRWSGSSDVRFVADTSIISRWSDAKG